jgi:hypothetical protein
VTTTYRGAISTELDNARLTRAFEQLVALADALAARAGVGAGGAGSASLDCRLFDCTLAWARGGEFGDACALTELMEGEVVRGLARLAQACREMAAAAAVLGDETLETQMARACQLVGRDVVLAPSLYVQKAK